MVGVPKNIHGSVLVTRKSFFVISALVLILASSFTALTRFASAASCPTPGTDYGSTTMTVTAPEAATYRIWSRIMAPDTASNSFSLEVDGANCYVVGDAAISPNAWTWVDYRDGNAASKLDISLSAGSHTLKLIGREASVSVDRVIISSDLACVPTGTGNNCTVVADTTPPTVSLSAPTNGSTVSGTVNIQASASDDGGIAKVEFYVDTNLMKSATSSPYSHSWDTKTVADGSHTVTAKAYDKAGNMAAQSAAVTVKNTDTDAPSAPSSLTATADSTSAVSLAWKASTDNIGVAGYWVQRDGVTLAKVGATTSFRDASVNADTTYAYQLLAFDAAGNLSQPSNTAQVTTPKPATADTEAPTAPSSLTAAAASSSQINLSWGPSADNVGVDYYNIYRKDGRKGPSVVATVTTTSFGDTNLRAGKTYSYYVTAVDAAGNESKATSTVDATTNQNPRKGKGGKAFVTPSSAYAVLSQSTNRSERG